MLNEESILTILIILFSVLIFIMLFLYIRNRSTGPAKETVIENTKKPGTPCVLCGSLLEKNQNIKSTKFQGKNDTIVHVYGCPNCYGPSATEKRICPVCKKGLDNEGYLIGRMFNTKKGKLHLHLNGCTVCRNMR